MQYEKFKNLKNDNYHVYINSKFTKGFLTRALVGKHLVNPNSVIGDIQNFDEKSLKFICIFFYTIVWTSSQECAPSGHRERSCAPLGHRERSMLGFSPQLECRGGVSRGRSPPLEHKHPVQCGGKSTVHDLPGRCDGKFNYILTKVWGHSPQISQNLPSHAEPNTDLSDLKSDLSSSGTGNLDPNPQIAQN